MPARGKRYSPAQKTEILEFAQSEGVESAAKKFNTTESSIYEWRRTIKRRGENNVTSKLSEKIEIGDPKEDRDRKILAAEGVKYFQHKLHTKKMKRKQYI